MSANPSAAASSRKHSTEPVTTDKRLQKTSSNSKVPLATGRRVGSEREKTSSSTRAVSKHGMPLHQSAIKHKSDRIGVNSVLAIPTRTSATVWYELQRRMFLALNVTYIICNHVHAKHRLWSATNAQGYSCIARLFVFRLFGQRLLHAHVTVLASTL